MRCFCALTLTEIRNWGRRNVEDHSNRGKKRERLRGGKNHSNWDKKRGGIGWQGGPAICSSLRPKKKQRLHYDKSELNSICRIKSKYLKMKNEVTRSNIIHRIIPHGNFYALFSIILWSCLNLIIRVFGIGQKCAVRKIKPKWVETTKNKRKQKATTENILAWHEKSCKSLQDAVGYVGI